MRKLFIILFWIAAIFAITMAIVEQPHLLPGNPSVRVQHVGAFMVLSLLAASAYPRVPLVRLFVLLTLFSAAIELVQAIPSINRVADWVDLVVDSVTVALTLFIVDAVRRVRRDPDQ